MSEMTQNDNGTLQNESPRTPAKRGFAVMDPRQQKEIASKGGKAAHRQGVAHEFNSEEARIAGRKGGMAVSQNREHMAEIGRKGGEVSGGNRSNRNAQRNGMDRSEE